MLLGTYRNGHEQINAAGKQDNSVVGENRLAPNPQNNKTGYFLTKHFYQVNETNKLGLTFELLRKSDQTNELTAFNSSGRRGMIYKSVRDNDSSSRFRLDLSNEYENDGLVWSSKFTYQNSETISRRNADYLKPKTTPAANIPGASGTSSAHGHSTGSAASTGTTSSTTSTTSSPSTSTTTTHSTTPTTTSPTTPVEMIGGKEGKRGEYSFKSFTFANEVRKNLELAGRQHQLALTANLSYAISDFNIHTTD